MQRLNLSMNVLPVLGELTGDVDQLIGDDPSDAASYCNRSQDGRKNGDHPAGTQLLEACHHRVQ